MLMQYMVPLLITALIAVCFVCLLRMVPGKTGAKVELIITGDEKTENLEQAIMIAKRLVQQYFKNAEIYVRGGSNTYTDALIRRYNVRRKD